MPELLKQAKLKDGRSVEIFRIVTPEPDVPDKVKRYIMASLSYEKYRQYVNDQAYWRLYYREALDGHTAEYVEDRLYYAEVEGQPAARLWYGYGRHNLRGNFGNVYTEPEYRRLGLMNMLLPYCVSDFQACPARTLCCASGNKYAVASYVKHGFKLIYGGETGPLCLGKAAFADETARAFLGGGPLGPLTIRPGTPEDQFACDKFLFYCDAYFHFPRRHRVGVARRISDYRIAYQEHLSEAGPVNVAVNAQGVVVGYCFALNSFGEAVLDFELHPAYQSGAQELLRRTADEYQAAANAAPLLYLSPVDSERLELAQSAGFHAVANVPGRFIIFE